MHSQRSNNYTICIANVQFDQCSGMSIVCELTKCTHLANGFMVLCLGAQGQLELRWRMKRRPECLAPVIKR